MRRGLGFALLSCRGPGVVVGWGPAGCPGIGGFRRFCSSFWRTPNHSGAPQKRARAGGASLCSSFRRRPEALYNSRMAGHPAPRFRVLAITSDRAFVALPVLFLLVVSVLWVHPEWSLAEGQFAWLLLIINTHLGLLSE